MSVDATIRGTLLANAALVALIGTRLFPEPLDQNAIAIGPCLTMARVSTQHLYAQDQANPNWGRNGWARVQFSAFGTGKSGAAVAESVASAVRVALKGFSSAFVINERQQVEPNTVPPVYMRILDTKIFITEEN